MNLIWANALSLQALARGLVQILYPNLCWSCRQPIQPEQRAFCSACHDAIFSDPRPSCPSCAATVGPFANGDAGCLACGKRGFAFDRALRIGPYEGPLRDLILRAKNGSAEVLAEVVGKEWAANFLERLRPLNIDCVVSVPLHWWRRWRRGYNQCDTWARALAGALGVPCRLYGLRRVRDTAKQTTLSPTARQQNMRGAFVARRTFSWTGKTVLLVDDVMTTGSTAHEAARPLRQAGAASIVVAILARAEA